MPGSKREPLIWRPALLERDNNRCVYCSKPFNPEVPGKHNIDHLIPKRHGGPTRPWNLAIACEDCNCRKHCKPDVRAIDLVIDHLRALIAAARIAIAAPRPPRWTQL